MKKQISRIFVALFGATLITLFVQPAWATGVKINGDINVSGGVSAASFSGNGAGLTGITGAAISNSSITVNNLADNAVTTDKLAVAAVTRDKIAFYGNVAVVAKSGGDYADPYAAMNDSANWCPRTATPCLLKIMPGVYDVGTNMIEMQPYIDIEGSGENTTLIQGGISNSSTGVLNGANYAEVRFLTVKNTGGGGSVVAIHNASASPKITNVTAIAVATGGYINYSYGIYNNASSPVLTNLTVTASGGASSYGILNQNASSPKMNNVSVSASGSGAGSGDSNTSYGVYNYASSPKMTNVSVTAGGAGGGNTYGVDNQSSSAPTMTNVIISASGGQFCFGVYNYASSPVMTNVSVTAEGSVNSTGVATSTSGTVKINHSVIKGATRTISNAAGVTTRVGNTQLDGGDVSNAGTLTCAGVYNENYVFSVDTCQ